MYFSKLGACTVATCVTVIAASTASAQQVKAPDTPPDIRYNCQIDGLDGFWPLVMWSSQGLCGHFAADNQTAGPCKITADKIEFTNDDNIFFAIERRDGNLAVALKDEKRVGSCQPGNVPVAAPQRYPDLAYRCEVEHARTSHSFYVWLSEGVCAAELRGDASRCTIYEDLISWPHDALALGIYRKSNNLYVRKFRQNTRVGICKLQ